MASISTSTFRPFRWTGATASRRSIDLPGGRARRSQLLRNAGVEAAARAELRSKNSDTGAVAKLVNLVEQVDDIEAHGHRLGVRRPLEFPRYSGIDDHVRRVVIFVGKARAQPAPVNQIRREQVALPAIRGAGRGGHELHVVGVVPMSEEKGVFIGVEKVLVRFGADGLGYVVGEVRVSLEAAAGIFELEFAALAVAARPIELGQHHGLAELG